MGLGLSRAGFKISICPIVFLQYGLRLMPRLTLLDTGLDILSCARLGPGPAGLGAGFNLKPIGLSTPYHFTCFFLIVN